MIKQTFKDLISPFVVGIQKGAPANTNKPPMISAGFVCSHCRYNIPDAVFLHLGEQNRDTLVPGRAGLNVSVSLLLLYGLFELISRNGFQHLREYDINFASGLFLLAG